MKSEFEIIEDVLCMWFMQEDFRDPPLAKPYQKESANIKSFMNKGTL